MPIVKTMADSPVPTLDNELQSGTYTEDEKSEILREIENASSSTHLQAATVVEVFRPRKRGVLFPVLINLAAVVLVVGGWFAAEAFFKTKQEGLKIKTSQLFGSEGSLLAKVLEDSKAELDAKNAEIGKIQDNLSKMASEKENLVAEFDNQLNAKEKALKADLAAQLESEKKRLQNSGISQVEIQQKLNEFETLKAAESAKAIESYRATAQAEIEKRNTELVAMQAKLSNTQAEQDKLKADLEKKTAAREKDLQGQLSSQGANLEKLARERDELNLFFRQADAQFAAVRAAVEASDPARALASVALLKTVLQTGSASTTEAVRVRSAADLVVANALEKAVGQLAEAAKKPEQDPKFEAFKTQMKRAQAAVIPDERVSLTSKALASVPEIQAAVDVLLAWENRKALATLAEKLAAAEAVAQREREAASAELSAVATELTSVSAELAGVSGELEQVKAALSGQNDGMDDLLQAWETEAADLRNKVDNLRVFKTKWTALTGQGATITPALLTTLQNPDADGYARARVAFLAPFSTEEGLEAFPSLAAGLGPLLDSRKKATVSEAALAAGLDPVPIRNQAFADVLLFTDYLQGKSETAKVSQQASEKLARTDDQYKKVVDAIQTLAQSGAKETIVKTNKYQLYGSVVSRTDNKLVIEPFTGAKPTVAQTFEVRRSSSKGETVLGQGAITTVGARKSEGDLAADSLGSTKPAAGDTIYLILP